MADQERAGGGLQLGQRPEVGGAFERGRDIPSVVVRDPKPLKDGKMERGSDCRGLGHEPVARHWHHLRDQRLRCGTGVERLRGGCWIEVTEPSRLFVIARRPSY